MHCLYDHSGALPSFLTVTDGKKHEVREIKDTPFSILLSSTTIVTIFQDSGVLSVFNRLIPFCDLMSSCLLNVVVS